MHNDQHGMTLLEVLLAMLVVAVAVLAAAALQVKALQATGAATLEAQVALAAHSEHERRQP
ncbi:MULTISPECIES: prepilin-type N-terminal cleavage/methylation domain-containing protein [Pseudomonas]|uniref:prepilin-type N-terminal cleavage/methylation domain-containing protein n=1 Tax=Pseudomonas TaxID=286 RepID=UPI001596EB29|nr:prepilin-type N-terminal cleavage/methylation domain-containing protein [Pseudomonas faucium]